MIGPTITGVGTGIAAQNKIESLPPKAEHKNPNPVDFVKELGVDLPSMPYTPYDPQGWVNRIADNLWGGVNDLLRHVVTLRPNYDYNQLPTPTQHRQWCRWYPQDRQWVALGSEEELPQFLVPDVESTREGKGSAVLEDPYRPFMVGCLGADRNSKELSYYVWRDQLIPGEDLLEIVPFPHGRVVANHNLTSYDVRYFSCTYDRQGPSDNIYLDTRAMMIILHGISDQGKALYAIAKNNQEHGGGVPAWVDNACPSGLKDAVAFKLGIDINKGVRDNFSKYTAQELAQAMLDANNLEVTPTTVNTYGFQDVYYTFLIFASLYPDLDDRIFSSNATWVGMSILGNLKVYVDGLDDFIIKSQEQYDLVDAEIRAVVKAQAQALVDQHNAIASVQTYNKLHTRILKAKSRLKGLEEHKSTLRDTGEDLDRQLQENSQECAELALARERLSERIAKLKNGRSEKELEGIEKESLARLKKERTQAGAAYKKASKAYFKTKTDKANVLARLTDGNKEDLKQVASDIRLLKDFLKENKDEDTANQELAIQVGTDLEPHLDWSYFASGERAGQIKWFADMVKEGFKLGGRDAVYLLKFRWQGFPIYYQKNEAFEGDTTGTWVAQREDQTIIKLPHLGGDDKNLGTPICIDYMRFVLSGELTSDVLDQERLRSLFKASENTGQWTSYQKRYREIYRVKSPFGVATATDTLVAGTLSARTTGTFVVLPKPSEKIGSNVQKMIIGPGAGRVCIDYDFAAQESKFLAMLVDCWNGVEFSTVWSRAVLTGEKSKKTDIHNLVANFCTNGLREFLAKNPDIVTTIQEVCRQDGKGLNFSSIYRCGVEKLATGLIKDSEFPPIIAKVVAETFMEYLKGPNGIALEEFRMLDRIANMPGYRTAALGRKIPNSLDNAYCSELVTTRSNWTIQGGCADLLHIVLTVMDQLCYEHKVDAWPMLTVHDSLKYSVLDSPKNIELFTRLFNFAHAVAKQAAYQGATAWARRERNMPELPAVWCPTQDIFFEEWPELNGLPSARVA